MATREKLAGILTLAEAAAPSVGVMPGQPPHVATAVHLQFEEFNFDTKKRLLAAINSNVVQAHSGNRDSTQLASWPPLNNPPTSFDQDHIKTVAG